jgi:hypothetical protein
MLSPEKVNKIVKSHHELTKLLRNSQIILIIVISK